ncbi:MAG: ATP-binding protein [Deltaproteobacteria bacterium]|nr:ATP-binding protein [Deltaproteobacteria bacterium]
MASEAPPRRISNLPTNAHRRSSLPPLLEACVEDGLISRDVAEAAESIRQSSGIGILRALDCLGLLEKEMHSSCISELDSSGNYRSLLLESPPAQDLTFSTFLACQANEFPLEVAKKVANGEAGPAFNPFYIYGGIGMGKTHLLSAITNAATSRPAILANMTDLEAEFERARRIECRAELRDWLSSADILLIDDVQSCDGDEEIQKELFAVFNKSQRKGHSIVFSSDVPPTRLDGIEKRLVSRLGGGVILGLQMCKKSERIKILERAFGDSALPMEVREYLADNVTDNIRSIKAAAKQLIALSDGTGTQINLDMARAVAPLPEDLHHSSTTPDSIIKETAAVEEEQSLPSPDRISLFREMLNAAESEDEQCLALQIAVGEKLRELRENNGSEEGILKMEKALELLREGNIEEAMKCTTI